MNLTLTKALAGNPIPRTVHATLRGRILFWDDERSIGNSLIVTLKYGWKFSNDPQAAEHVMGFDKVSEANLAVREAVPCACAECSGKH